MKILPSLLLSAVLGLACRTTPAEPPAGSGGPPPAEVSAGPQAEADPPQAAPEPSAALESAAALYEQCRERVEGPESDGECSSDADCTTGGCSQEICATAESLAGMMSTCETLPCFRVLETCGCNEGRCTWTVAEPEPGTGPAPVVLPPLDRLVPEPSGSEPAPSEG